MPGSMTGSGAWNKSNLLGHAPSSQTAQGVMGELAGMVKYLAETLWRVRTVTVW